MRQLIFPFVGEIDQQIAADKKAEAERMTQLRDASHLKWCLEQYPPINEEWDVMLMGIRLCRFVSDLECRGCKLSYKDHTIGWQFPTKVCLKDYCQKCKEWGIKPRLT